MKKLIDISDEDALAVINRIHILTENRILGRFGLLGLDFHESFRRYGSAYMDFELASYDFVSDGHYTSISKCRIEFHHESVWFMEFSSDDDISGYNKNHFFGYLKLQELGYKLPDKPQ